MIPIITTCDIEKKYSSYARENDSFQSYFVPDVIDDLSDNILFSRSESGNKMNVVVIKPVRPSMGGYYMLPAVTNFKNWYMSYSNKDTRSNRINEEMACEDSPNEDIIITSTSNMEDTDTLTSSSISNYFDPFNESDGRKTLEEIKDFMLKNDDEGGKQHE